MKIKLHGLRKGVNEIFQTIDPGDINLPQDYFKSPVEVKLWLEDVGELINADFNISTVSETDCCRCLESMTINLDLEGRILLMPAFKTDFSDSDDVVLFNPDRPEADISQNLLDELMLALPFRPLCSEDCKGICPDCGANLNETTCGCKVEKIDPRWSALSGLKEQFSEE